MPMSNTLTDQASGLRKLLQPRPVQVVAVASGKGGVGKTNVSVNLSVALAAAGRDVMLLDADLGLANIDVLLGMQPRFNLSHLIDGSRTLSDIIVSGPAGLNIVPGSSGIAHMANLNSMEHAGVIRAFSELSYDLDILVVDVAAGLTETVTSFARACQEVIVVVCDEPASITDAYALIKVLSRDFGVTRLHVLSNMVQNPQEGRILYHKLAKVCERFLDVALHFMGTVPFDIHLRKAVQRQRAVVEAFPASPSAQAFKKLAVTAQKWPIPKGSRGNLEFFVERLIGNGNDPRGYLV
jgi:flagellar biosynthesis protein FlhG